MSTQPEKIDCGAYSAILFSRISRVGVFQQPQDLTPVAAETPQKPRTGSLCPVVILSGARTSRSEIHAESKDPYSVFSAPAASGNSSRNADVLATQPKTVQTE